MKNTACITCEAHGPLDRTSDSVLQIITIDGPADGCLPISVLTEADEKDCPKVEIHADDVVCLPYSSGTTGLPKGVMLTHRSLISSVAQQVDGECPNLHLTQHDIVMCVLPMFHIYSLNSILLCSLRVGAALVIMPRFDFQKLLELTQNYKVCLICSSFHLLLDLNSLSACCIGSNVLIMKQIVFIYCSALKVVF